MAWGLWRSIYRLQWCNISFQCSSQDVPYAKFGVSRQYSTEVGCTFMSKNNMMTNFQYMIILCNSKMYISSIIKIRKVNKINQRKNSFMVLVFIEFYMGIKNKVSTFRINFFKNIKFVVTHEWFYPQLLNMGGIECHQWRVSYCMATSHVNCCIAMLDAWHWCSNV